MIYLNDSKNKDKKFLKNFFEFATNNYLTKISLFEKCFGFIEDD